MFANPTSATHGQSSGPDGRSASPVIPAMLSSALRRRPDARRVAKKRSEISAQSNRPAVPAAIVTASEMPAAASR